MNETDFEVRPQDNDTAVQGWVMDHKSAKHDVTVEEVDGRLVAKCKNCQQIAKSNTPEATMDLADYRAAVKQYACTSCSASVGQDCVEKLDDLVRPTVYVHDNRSLTHFLASA